MVDQPAKRRLRILAFDPSLATRLETSVINEIIVEVPWEDDLREGPIGEYIEVIDVDPASGVCYRPVNLNDPYLLAQDGLPPSESNPQFHQEMVYAVAMITIRNFERALGRPALWADRRVKTAEGGYVEQFVRRLRIYPHALRDRNAYYCPSKKSLLFGYFPVTTMDADNTPGTVVFTCLSHDIVAHEVTHALLDGVHPRFNESSNPDVLAFHEAFADIVALFQHFSHPTVLADQIRRTRGDLESESLLAQLAQQFGQATGRGSALRDALGSVNRRTGEWVPRQPDPHALEHTWGPHDRGSILVAAVFRAFLLTYRARSADLFRIATQGTGTLPEGDIHPDLTRRLATEAAGSADRILQMCIRAIDYCPPVDITFGDFLRGVVTADIDFAPGDGNRSLVAFIESFRDWGIYPRGVSSMGLDALEWPTGDERFEELFPGESLARSPEPMRKERREEKRRDMKQGFVKSAAEKWTLGSNRKEIWEYLPEARADLRNWLLGGDSFGPGQDYARIFGLVIDNEQAPSTVFRVDQRPSVEVHSVRPAVRRTIDGAVSTDLVVEITQRRRGYFDPDEQQRMDSAPVTATSDDTPCDFKFRAGCTALINPRNGEVRRVITTRGTIADDDELERVRAYLTGVIGGIGNAFDAGLPESQGLDGPPFRNELFALLHQMED